MFFGRKTENFLENLNAEYHLFNSDFRSRLLRTAGDSVAAGITLVTLRPHRQYFKILRIFHDGGDVQAAKGRRN